MARNGTLILENGDFSTEVIVPSGPESGTIYLDGASMTYNDVSSIIDTTTVDNFTMEGSGGNAQVNFVNDPKGTENKSAADQINSTTGTFASLDFANKTNVTFEGGPGSDTYTINITTQAKGLKTLAVVGAARWVIPTTCRTRPPPCRSRSRRPPASPARSTWRRPAPR